MAPACRPANGEPVQRRPTLMKGAAKWRPAKPRGTSHRWVPFATLPAAHQRCKLKRPVVPVRPGPRGCETPGELALRAASRPVGVPPPTSDHASPSSPSEHIHPGQVRFAAARAPPDASSSPPPRLLLHGDSHAITHQHLGAVGAHHTKDDVELKAGGTRRGRHSLEMGCTCSTC
jgi:hypothetical protein